jgi:hypothetical protein
MTCSSVIQPVPASDPWLLPFLPFGASDIFLYDSDAFELTLRLVSTYLWQRPVHEPPGNPCEFGARSKCRNCRGIAVVLI